MANRHQRDIYCFISDSAGMYKRATQSNDGTYIITKNAQPYPIRYNPKNIISTPLEFATNRKYFSLVRSISYPLDFIKDGAAILSDSYFNGKLIEEKLYLTVIQWNGVKNLYELSYTGRFDFGQRERDPKAEVFTCSTIDDSAWGVLSQNDSVQYAIDCSQSNPKSIPVLFDGLTLLNRYTFQTVRTSLVHTFDPVTGIDNTYTVPIVLINEDGDSSGLVVKDQQFNDASLIFPEGWFFTSSYGLTNGNIAGSIEFQWDGTGSGTVFQISFRVRGNVVAYNIYTIMNPIKLNFYRFTFDVDLAAVAPDEKLYFLMEINAPTDSGIEITLINTNIFFSTKTKPQAIIAYGLRAIDLLQALVQKATNSRFTINSNFFEENNKDICFAGDSFRGVPNAKIYSSVADFFKTFDSLYYMAFRQIMGALFMEKAIEVYKQDSVIIDLGEAIDYKDVTALEYYGNEVEAGSPKQDYRHPSGRLEFNSENTWSLPIETVNKKLNFVTKYRTGCYDITFLILDYQGSSTQDNNGDKSVYVARITDEQDMAVDDIETFENITIDDEPLEPIIKSPLNNDVISFDRPVIRGIAPPSSTVNIYVDTVLDGGTIADVNGNWSYNIVNPLTSYVPTVTTGIHVIDATYTDETAPVSSITVTIDVSNPTATLITYPQINSSLYNNLPLIKGVSQQGDNFDVLLDGVIIGNVTADESCKWTLQSPVIGNGAHVITANGSSVNFNVDSAVAFPLITYVGSELDGFLIINNLPLIKGVAIPGTIVTLWLNYITYQALNTTPIVADANGDWSYQVIPINYVDPGTGIPVVLAPIRNGLSIISTSLINHTVGIVVVGYKLSRPDYSSITGVIDNTVFNTEYSPARMLENHYPMLSAITNKQGINQITFETADKNGNLRTELNGVVVQENANIPLSSLGIPIALLEIVKIKTKANKTFSDTLYDFSNGGLVKFNFRGTDVYCLPVGNMKINNLTADVQEWELLMSPLTTYTALLNMYKNGTLITLNNNTMYHSDYNTLHFVKYNFVQLPKYNDLELYDDWFANRNAAWILNPYYIQKLQTTESFSDQIITRGMSSLNLTIYRCSDAKKIDTIPYVSVFPAPLNPPEIVQEAFVDLANYPEDRYFFVISQLTNLSTLITVTSSRIVSLNFYSATISGTVTVGDIVNIVLVNDSGTYQYSSTVKNGWALDDIILDLINKIEDGGQFTAFSVLGLTILVSSIIGNIDDGTLYATGPQVETNIAISEKIHTKQKWEKTILIEGSNSKNLVGAYFSTGFRTILRVEGLVKKYQPSMLTYIADEENGDTEMLYSVIAKKRTIRFGTAYGLPDYLYLKIAAALGLDEMAVEGVFYTLDKDEKINPSEDVDGHPLYYYNVNLTPQENTNGVIFPGGPQPETSVIFMVDASAFGLRPGTLTQIEILNE